MPERKQLRSADDIRHHLTEMLTEAAAETEQTLREELAADGYDLATVQKRGMAFIERLQLSYR